MPGNIRAQALQRIAALSADSSNSSFDKSDLDRLCRACHSTRGREFSHVGRSAKQYGNLGRIPMVSTRPLYENLCALADSLEKSIREFEVLLALCKTAPNIQSSLSAQNLSYRLIPYLLEAHTQVFASSPHFRKVDPSPNEALAFHLSAALLSLGIRHGDLKETVRDGIWAFISACGRAIDNGLSPQSGEVDLPPIEDAIRTGTIALALLGFLDAASAQADFWTSGSRLALIQKINQLLSEPFLVAVETSLSTIRNTHVQNNELREWKRLLRHYAARGRPFGAILLQRSFMWLVLSSTSLMIASGEELRKQHNLDLLLSTGSGLQVDQRQLLDGDVKSIEVYVGIAIEQMDYLEAGADFVRLASAEQQKLAYDIKSAAMMAYLNCAHLNEDIADSDVLMAWLQECLEDPAQMSDPDLATVVLRCMALICRIAPPYASSVSRALPRFLVQSAPFGVAVKVASESLAFVLKMLSKDAMISTLYSLGNVLSPDSEAELVNGSATNGDSAEYGRRGSSGSSISFLVNGEQETSIVYGNVVQAICTIATTSEDEKITALAQSMLLQKLDKVNASVDSKVIAGAAKLSLHGGQLEFRSLLKTFSRLCHAGVVDHKDFLLIAVSCSTHNLAQDVLLLTSVGVESTNAHLC